MVTMVVPHKLPSLAKEGWTRHQENGPLPLKARPGWFVQQPIIGGLNQPPRLRPLRRLRGILLMGAATPPLLRRGVLFGCGFAVLCLLWFVPVLHAQTSPRAVLDKYCIACHTPPPPPPRLLLDQPHADPLPP